MADRPPPLIRDATPDDAARIAQVHVATWRTTYRGLLPDSLLDGLDEARRREWWARLLGAPPDADTVVLVAQAGGDVVGFASGGRPASPVAGFDGELWALYVLAAWQGRGIGRALVGSLAGRLADAGRSSLVAWVLVGNPAERFYAALGGREVGRKTDQIGGVEAEEVAYGWPDTAALRALAG